MIQTSFLKLQLSAGDSFSCLRWAGINSPNKALPDHENRP